MKTRNYISYLCLGLLTFNIGCSSDDSVPYSVVVSKDINDPIQGLITPTSFYIANEGWFGRENGSVNGFDYEGKPSYRLFTNANPGQDLGVTTQFATAYGDHYFAVSKQGNRLVMMDKNFKHQSTLTNIGGDGRSFVGINKNKAYVSTSAGISVVKIDGQTMSIDKTIAGYTSEVGTMVYRNNLVYAATIRGGLIIIDTTTDTLLAYKAAETVNQLTIDRVGNIWAGSTTSLYKYDTSLPVEEQIAKRTVYSVEGYGLTSSGGWNAGSLSASAKRDVLYWKSGKSVVEFDIATGKMNTSFYTIDKDAEGKALMFYGGGLRVDPVTDDLVLTLQRSDYSANNYVQIVSNSGSLKKDVYIAGGTQNTSNGHYWFSAIPFFQDNNAPQIISNKIVAVGGQEKSINLNEIVFDQDNPQALIEVSVAQYDSAIVNVKIEDSALKITALQPNVETEITLKANSNGKETTKVVRVESAKIVKP